ncbi:MAG TPA: hypothetical protein DCM28_19610 [Phycisphaerales bacterium]|nr:hypothetical protein [Phycisphaerales bacterium]HCD32864.1 hypothetical protein [Phycisphaerales bacterium]|tara:strand:- start:2158 stop:2619 length:462 start_codon:yes stop_codon:yes gene_type:complete
MKTHNTKYQLCIIGLLGLVVGMLVASPSANEDQPEKEHVYAQYQSPQDGLFQTVGNGKEITNDQLALFQSIFDLINQYTAVVDNPTACSVAAIMSIDDHVSTPEESIKLLESTLQSATNDKVRRAIRLKLLELYSKVGQKGNAHEMLRKLIIQ